jgi:hypothetical protein
MLIPYLRLPRIVYVEPRQPKPRKPGSLYDDVVIHFGPKVKVVREVVAATSLGGNITTKPPVSDSDPYNGYREIDIGI